jgi:hypothetical protein
METRRKITNCKRCGCAVNRDSYAEHLARTHNDFSKMKMVVMPTATICVRCKNSKIVDFIHGTCIECSKQLN